MIIKLNLLPKKEKKRLVLRLNWFKLYVFVLFVLILAIFSSFILVNRQVVLLEKKKVFLQQERNSYQKVIKKIEELKKQDEEIKNRIEAIINLKKKRGYNLKVLDNVLLALPLGKIYLTHLELNTSTVSMVGFSIDYENVAKFLKNLEDRGLFKEVNLQYTTQKSISGYSLVEFRIWVSY